MKVHGQVLSVNMLHVGACPFSTRSPGAVCRKQRSPTAGRNPSLELQEPYNMWLPFGKALLNEWERGGERGIFGHRTWDVWSPGYTTSQ